MNSEPSLSSASGRLGEAHWDEIEAVAAVLRDSAVLTQIEVRQGDFVLRVRRSSAAPAPPRALPAPLTPPLSARKNGTEPASPRVETVPAIAGGNAAAFTSLLPLPAEKAAEAATPVTASLVGVFHAGRAPLAPGDRVAKGQAVGQIEAMRLMNDVSAPVEGVVAAVHVEEGQPVEYGQALFEIVPAGAAAPEEKVS